MAGKRPRRTPEPRALEDMSRRELVRLAYLTPTASEDERMAAWRMLREKYPAPERQS